MRVFLGVDPGLSGGMALVSETRAVWSVLPWLSVGEMVEQLSLFLDGGGKVCLAVVEKVGPRPAFARGKDGKVARVVQGAASSWKFAKNAGQWEGILGALKIPAEYVSPAKWTRALGVVGKRVDPWSGRRKAEQLYPAQAKYITAKTADALLLAEYGLRTFGRREEG